jgi:hypothetical protein
MRVPEPGGPSGKEILAITQCSIARPVAAPVVRFLESPFKMGCNIISKNLDHSKILGVETWSYALVQCRPYHWIIQRVWHKVGVTDLLTLAYGCHGQEEDQKGYYNGESFHVILQPYISIFTVNDLASLPKDSD